MQQKNILGMSRYIVPALVSASVLVPMIAFGAGTPTFTTQLYPTGGHPATVAIGDLNGDTFADLAVGDTGQYTAGHTVSILLGNGDGTFQPRTAYTTGSSPFTVAIGLLNNDTYPDLAVANSDDNTISILLGNGDGTFQPQTTYAAGSYPLKLVLSDFNGDGELDIAVTNLFGSNVSVLLGNGDGTFQPQVTYATGSGPYGISVGNFDAGSSLDVAITNVFNNTVSILLGNGDGTFQPQTTLGVGVNPQSIAAADLNGDTKEDLAVANGGSNTLSILLGNGDGTFQPQTTYAAAPPLFAVLVADMNGDSIGDLVVTNSNNTAGTVSVYVGNGDGTFQSPTSYPAGLGPTGIALGDLNGDSRLDVAATDYNRDSIVGQDTVAILLNTGTASMLTSLSPAKVWVGLKNSDDVGTKFDLYAEVYKDTSVIASGQVNSVAGGSSGFNNAKLDTIPLTLTAPVSLPSGSTLKIKVYVRNACVGPTHNSGTARLWYNGSDANSQFGATVDASNSTYYLRSGSTLSSTPGSAKVSVDVAAGAPCSAFKPFGTWNITTP